VKGCLGLHKAEERQQCRKIRKRKVEKSSQQGLVSGKPWSGRSSARLCRRHSGTGMHNSHWLPQHAKRLGKAHPAEVPARGGDLK
jgi:hypothetical protein